MVGEQTQQNKELLAQGVANGAVALLGGIPGAMATIRSVLVLKEGGTQRIVGVFIGVFVLVEMLLFQDLISIIPQAVFAGILFKVGYDVFDFEPVLTYVRRWGATERKSADALFVSHLEIMLIAGTTIATLLWNLNAAVGLCTALFYLINKVLCRDNPIRDLKPYEGHGVGCED
jgi:SulP family sulfate permease